MPKTNLIKFLPPMTFNENFIYDFAEMDRPCAALGVIETVGRQKGFLAFKPTNPFNESTGQNGFDLGTELLGNSKVAVLHLILNFDETHIYDIFLNLNAPAVKKVLKLWQETGDYFFFVFSESGFKAFNQTLGGGWYEHDYFGMMEKAANTVQQYESAVDSVINKNSDMLHGSYLELIFQNKVEYLDLTEHRYEVRASFKDN